jgi:hypothetical protein
MTNQQIESFLMEIGGVCARHRIGCFVGLWFGGPGSDAMGISANHDITDIEMKLLSQHLTQFLTDYQHSIFKGKQLGTIRGTTTGAEGEQN